jgi:hypothetical protein
MNHAPYVDPIEHAWRHCNPHAQLPSSLTQHVAPSRFARSLYRSHRQLLAAWSGNTHVQDGLLTVATLPRISPQSETECHDEKKGPA